MGNGNSNWIEILNDNWSGGALRLRVKGRSMWPTLQPGDHVMVEPAAIADLRAGDLVLLRNKEDLFLHRLLGFTRSGLLLTKGDSHRAPDTPWPPKALLGRATTLSRQGETVAVSPSSIRERARTALHRLIATTWSLLHRVGLLLLLLAVPTVIVSAAVTLISFEATLVGDDVLIAWETASHIGTSAFYIQRKHQDDIYLRISPRIDAAGDSMAPASYVYTDTTIEQGNTYYYRLEDVQDDGSSQFHGPISITIPLPPSPTPPPPPPPPLITPSPTPTPGPTSTPPTGTPPTSTPTHTPTRTPTPTYTPTAGGGNQNTPTETAIPTSTQTPMPEQGTVVATVIPEPEIDLSNATATPNPTSQPTALSALAAQATDISPTTDEQPQPSPSPDSSGVQPIRGTASGKGSSFPWGLILALIVAAGTLILLGGLGLWWMRQKK